MHTTLKRVDIGSAFRVGVILYGLIFLVFGLVFVLFQGLLLNLITRSTTFNLPNTPNGSGSTTAFLGAGILGLLCFYGIGIVVAAIFGGIQCAILAFFYNLTARWVGGIKVELETSDTGLLDDIERDMGKRKRDDL